MKKKIVITGISSPIKQRLCLLIDRSVYEVIGISRNPDSVQIDRLKLVPGDLLDIHPLEYCFRECHMIIHGAAITHSRHKSKYYAVNLEVTKSLVDIAKDHGIQRLVFISSNTAGTKSGTYGLTKLLAEEYVKEHSDDWIILRLSEVYGGSKNEGIEKLINSVLNNTFILCPTGIPSRFYPIHIEDVVRIMHNRIFNQRNNNRICVINGPEGFSYREMIELAKSVSGRKIRVIYLNRSFMRIIKVIASISPVNIGIAPDQVDRLYGVKHIEEQASSMMTMETYLRETIENRAKD